MERLVLLLRQAIEIVSIEYALDFLKKSALSSAIREYTNINIIQLNIMHQIDYTDLSFFCAHNIFYM